MRYGTGILVGAVGAFLVTAAIQKLSPATYPFYPHGTVAYMMPLTLAPNTANVILIPAANTDAARSAVMFLCNGLEQWQDEGVDPENHRWCKPM